MVTRVNIPASYAPEAEVMPATGGSISAVSWGAIIAGASVAAASSVVLLMLAVGLGYLNSASWPYLSGARMAVGAAIALTVVQWISSALGGYITGRLRTRWVGLHTHEVFFRDTAHGFITWSVATLAAAFLLASAAAASVSDQDTTASYRMQRHGHAAVERMMERDAVGQKEGAAVTPAAQSADGIKRTDLPELADVDRSSAAKASILVTLSMVIGAFIASVSAALGGRLRDQHP
ncbi:MAG TPA: hypothetical protein VMG33_13155 [Steroidobacteraceae bacterium]|nr:hypothetical protein [Steroidobacteraceae bacterium]